MKNKFFFLIAFVSLVVSFEANSKGKKDHDDYQQNMSTTLNIKKYYYAPIVQNAHEFRKQVKRETGASFKLLAHNKRNPIVKKLPLYKKTIKNSLLFKKSLNKRISKAIEAKREYDLNKSNSHARRQFKAREKVMKALPKIDDGSGFGYTFKDDGDIAVTEYGLDSETARNKILNLSTDDNSFFDSLDQICKEMKTPIKEVILFKKRKLQ